MTVPASLYRDSGKSGFVAPAAIAFTFGSVTVPSLASVYNEAALKRQMDTSVHLQNFFLYFYGALFNMLGSGVMLFVRQQPLSGMFDGLGKVSAVLHNNNVIYVILHSCTFLQACPQKGSNVLNHLEFHFEPCKRQSVRQNVAARLSNSELCTVDRAGCVGSNLSRIHISMPCRASSWTVSMVLGFFIFFDQFLSHFLDHPIKIIYPIALMGCL